MKQFRFPSAAIVKGGRTPLDSANNRFAAKHVLQLTLQPNVPQKCSNAFSRTQRGTPLVAFTYSVYISWKKTEDLLERIINVSAAAVEKKRRNANIASHIIYPVKEEVNSPVPGTFAAIKASNAVEVLLILKEAIKGRPVAAAAVNATSSRTHLLITIILVHSGNTSTLEIFDLCGNEPFKTGLDTSEDTVAINQDNYSLWLYLAQRIAGNTYVFPKGIFREHMLRTQSKNNKTLVLAHINLEQTNLRPNCQLLGNIENVHTQRKQARAKRRLKQS